MPSSAHITEAGGARPVRVLHLVSTFAVKTDTKWLFQLLRRQDRARFDTAIACFYGGGPMRERFERIGVRTFNLNIPQTYDPRGITRAAALMNRWKPDVVHTHLLRADLLGGLAARLIKVDGLVSNAYAIGSFRRAKRRMLDPLLDALCSRLPAQVIAVSDAVKTDCIERLQVETQAVNVIHTGIEPVSAIEYAEEAAQFRARCNAHPEIPLIVTVARLSYEKGIDTLLEAAVQLDRRGVDFRLALVGDGPLRVMLEERAFELGIAGKTYFCGFTENVWPALTAADVCCIPSKSEGFPNVMLEAMSVSRAIVATRAGGIVDALEHQQNAMLVDTENAEQLATALERVATDRELAFRLGAAARSTLLRRFHVRDVVMRYESFYEDVVYQGRAVHAGAIVGT